MNPICLHYMSKYLTVNQGRRTCKFSFSPNQGCFRFQNSQCLWLPLPDSSGLFLLDLPFCLLTLQLDEDGLFSPFHAWHSSHIYTAVKWPIEHHKITFFFQVRIPWFLILFSKYPVFNIYICTFLFARNRNIWNIGFH